MSGKKEHRKSKRLAHGTAFALRLYTTAGSLASGSVGLLAGTQFLSLSPPQAVADISFPLVPVLCTFGPIPLS